MKKRPPQSIFFVDVINPKGHPCEVQISDDTGTPDNWIHPYIVTQYSLTCKDLPEPRCYEDASGNGLQTKRYVRLHWIGKDDRKYYNRFYVGSERVNIPRLILGNRFVTDNGRAAEVCRLDQRVQDAKILIQAPVTAQEAIEINRNGAQADADAARLARARELNPSRRKHTTSTRHKGKKSEMSETTHIPTVHEDNQSIGLLCVEVLGYSPPLLDDNGIYGCLPITPPADKNDTNDGLNINWGPWAQLANGQWHREGQDSSGNWYEENVNQDPR